MSTRKQNMIDYLPQYYLDSIIVSEKIGQESAEIDLINAKILEVLDQFFVNTATWGLDRWELPFGLDAKQYNALSWNSVETEQLTFAEAEEHTWDDLSIVANEIDIAQRRSNIIAKMRGMGTVTADLIKQVVLSYTNGECEVIEDNANYQVTIKFVDVDGVPPNLDQAKAAVNEIIPAHIGVLFTNEYSLWSDVKATTWDNLANYSWDDVKGGLWNA